MKAMFYNQVPRSAAK